MNFPENLKYTKDHEWISVEGDVATVGITDFAQDALGDVVFVELPEIDAMVAKGDEVSVIESVKAASDILSPLDGEIVEVNEMLTDNPGKVNEDAQGDGWFFKLKVEYLSAVDEYLDEKEYKDLIG